MKTYINMCINMYSNTYNIYDKHSKSIINGSEGEK